MKRKIWALMLSLMLALSLVPSAQAAGFWDISDSATARDAETLRLMGVIEGDGNGAFRPGDCLTRAEFCKMAVVLTGKRGVAARYGSRTVFPDVRATHWAAGYVNYAASKDAGLIHGMPDGTFQPERSIRYGEAVAILTRQLGYTDQDSGGIWPDGYIALASGAGMTKGISAAGDAEITRAQAARLFVNALTAKDDKDQTLLARLGYSVDLSDDPVTLYTVDASAGRLRLSDKSDPKLERPTASTVLNGVKGRVVLNADKEAVTFLPEMNGSGAAIPDAAVIVPADGSTAGFDALTGGAAGYALYRNGVRATAAELRKNDVAVYDTSNNTVQVTNTRVLAYYENCEPSQADPATIQTLGGTEFSVLPTARESLAKFRPGQKLILLLTADGRAAGAVAAEGSGVSGNALAYVGRDGGVLLLCGASLKKLNCSGSGLEGQVVRVSQTGREELYLSRQSTVADALDLTAMKLGARTVAEDAVVIENGAMTTVAALDATRIERGEIAYYRESSAGRVDLIVLDSTADNVFYGRALVSADDDGPQTVAVDYGSGTAGPVNTIDLVRTGDYIMLKLDIDRTRQVALRKLTKLEAVPDSAWVGDSAVTFGGRTYTLNPKTVLCYNYDAGAWFSAPSSTENPLDAARRYGGKMDCYVMDDVVRVIEVRS